MAEYFLYGALPQSAPGNTEYHFGHKATVKPDGVWIELDEISAKNFMAGGRIKGPIIPDGAKTEKKVEAAKAPEVVIEVAPVVEDKPQTMTEVVESGSGTRRGRPSKSAE